ncbi:MAG TPA: antitoxin Xre/MbcA/ParS toxin-binding domain-containing protein [Gemmatimonadales bacterium]|nr:antitoxin Xre/MbcA/ParS toxin-binding domain-containing protein [Gemmatimonadales bacterium]
MATSLRHPTRPRAPQAIAANEYASLLGLRARSPLAVAEQVSKGIGYEAFEKLRGVIELPAAELARLVNIPSRTLHRRKIEKRLHADESDRLVRLSRVFAEAIALFEGDREEARRWFSSPAPALGDRTPLSMTSTDVGAREVEALIGRLEYGVFA